MMQHQQRSDDEMMLRHRKGESVAEITTVESSPTSVSQQRSHRLQHRRSFSASRLEDVHTNENRVRKSQPDNPIHKPRDSIFSSRNSQLQNFTGFVNWAFLVLTLGGIRLFLENFIKYGVRVDPTQWLIILTKRNEAGFDYHSPILISYVIIPILSCFCFEIAMSKNAISSKIGLYLQIMNLLSIVLTPLFVIHVYGATFSLIGSACVCFVYCIVFLKLWSYVHVNVWCRRAAAVASTGCFSCPLEPSHSLPASSSASQQSSSSIVARNGKAIAGTSAHATSADAAAATENRGPDTVDHHLDYQYHQHLHHQHRRSKSKSILDSCSKSKQLFQEQQSCENNKKTNSNHNDEMSTVAAAAAAAVDDTDISCGRNSGGCNKSCDQSPSNGTARVATAPPQIQLVAYPDNLNVRDLAYFMVVPTLCYELNFPRTSRIRKRFLIKRVFEVCIGLNLMICLIQQYMVPCVKNSLIPFSNMDVAKAAERLLKLAIPNHLIWLCGFYLLFHSFLNVLGELFYFADRNFYCDWWNANNVNVFWRTWNMPVHRWALRHLYLPIIELGYDRNVAVFVVFFLSAFFHEYLLSAPLKTFKVWAFGAMMSQIPLTFASSLFEQRLGPKWGNVIVWASIIVGQPLCIMIYYHDYVITNFGKELLDAYAHV